MRNAQIIAFVACTFFLYGLDFLTTSYALNNRLGQEVNPFHVVFTGSILPWIWALTIPIQIILFIVSEKNLRSWSERNIGKVHRSDVWNFVFLNNIRGDIKERPSKLWITVYAGMFSFIFLHFFVVLNNTCIISLGHSCVFFPTDFGTAFGYIFGMVPALLVATVLALLLTVFLVGQMLEEQNNKEDTSNNHEFWRGLSAIGAMRAAV